MAEVVGCEAEEVHRHGCVLCKWLVGTAIVEYDCAIHALNLCALDHATEVALLIHGAYTARHGAILRESLRYLIAHHAVAALATLQALEVVADGCVCCAAVEVVGIDYGEWLVDGLCCHHHCVVCAPRLNATLGECEALGEVVELLEYILHLNLVAEALGVEHLLKICLEGVADYEYHLAEACANSVVNRVVDNSLAVRAYAIHLLERTIARTHARCQYQKCRFYHNIEMFL